jgi:hypothetical protein
VVGYCRDQYDHQASPRASRILESERQGFSASPDLIDP